MGERTTRSFVSGFAGETRYKRLQRKNMKTGANLTQKGHYNLINNIDRRQIQKRDGARKTQKKDLEI